VIRLAPQLGDGCLRLLCLGAHSDDIEIGCGGSLLRWVEEFARVEVMWVIFSAEADRADEAKRSAESLMRKAASLHVVLGDFADSRLPADFTRAKTFIASVRDCMQPDVVLTHRLDDRHQDHRSVAELTWQTWRNHLILEYEVPKYEGDLGQPNMYVSLDSGHRERKVDHLLAHFGTQRSKEWFNAETFNALMRLRGIECRSESGYAEAFHARKISW
jgi:LmbE family N-acetylglucosaminyl deacetylase